MEVNIHDYVSHDEIKEAVLEGIKGYAASNAERVISNCGHHVATDVVNAHLGVGAEADIVIKAKEVIADLSGYTIFDRGGYGRPPSDARKVLDQCVRENKEDLSKAVKAAIHNLSKPEIVDIVKSGSVKLVIE